jgi:hypothetical protein
VVASSLQYLGEEALDAATCAGNRRVEEHQARLLNVGSRGND